MKKSGWPTTSRHARGYGTEWGKTRLRILARDNGLCQCEECQGGHKRLTYATEVHHIVSKAAAARLGWSKDRTEADDNLAAINKDCHMRETASEQGRSLKPMKVGTAQDGWPIRSVR